MNHCRRFCLLLSATCAIVCASASAATGAERLVRVATLQIPGTTRDHQFKDFDLGFVDSTRDLYLLSDISNKSIDAFRASTGEFLFRIGGFFGHVPPGYSHVGPTGVITVDGEIWAADAPSTVKVIGGKGEHPLAISTGGTARADTLSYDERDQIVLVTNPDDVPRFVTLISAKPGHAVLGRIDFPRATGELEASAWWRSTGLFYLLIAEVDGDPAKGAVMTIDPVQKTVVSTFLVPQCRPTGIAIGDGEEALVGCLGEGLGKNYGFPPQTLIINLRTGEISAKIDGVVGEDQVWFNPGDKRYYVAAEANRKGPTLAAISADNIHSVLTAPTHPSAHSVAADAVTNRVFVPFGPTPTDRDCRNGCVAVFAVVTDRKN